MTPQRADEILQTIKNIDERSLTEVTSTVADISLEEIRQALNIKVTKVMDEYHIEKNKGCRLLNKTTTGGHNTTLYITNYAVCLATEIPSQDFVTDFQFALRDDAPRHFTHFFHFRPETQTTPKLPDLDANTTMIGETPNDGQERVQKFQQIVLGLRWLISSLEWDKDIMPEDLHRSQLPQDSPPALP